MEQKTLYRVLACYPDIGQCFQRGEDRCQSNIKASTATSMRACNDLGYIAAVLRKHEKIEFIDIYDYQTQSLMIEEGRFKYPAERFLEDDINRLNIDTLIIATTNGTIFDDIKCVNECKAHCPSLKRVILKGAIFYDAVPGLLEKLDLSNIDILVGGEIECLIGQIMDSFDNLSDVPNIFYKENETWIKNRFGEWETNLDSIPFPARDLMPNGFYLRPDNNEMMATIQTSRGCPSNCIYCLSPVISGKRVRFRSPLNVYEELVDCFENHGIRNFFFKSDTFTIDKEWVLELCRLIEQSDLNGRIAYTANSRVNPLSKEVLEAMKRTGCFTIAFGFETGSEETMKKICKGATIEQNKRAVQMCKEVGIPVYGFFMIGFPWENMSHLKDTEKLIFDLDCDFIELHVALPYYGSKFYDMCKEEGTLSDAELGTDYFHSSTKGTKHLSIEEILDFRNKVILKYHCRPSYVVRKVVGCKFSPKVVSNLI